MKCKNCGEEIANDSNFCEFCGVKVNDEASAKNNHATALKVASLIIPLIGFILYGRKREEEPLLAQSCLKYCIWGSIMWGIVIIVGVGSSPSHKIATYDESYGTTTYDYVDLGLPSGTKWKLTNETVGTDGFCTYDEAVNAFGDKLPTKEQFEELQNACTWIWTGSGYEVIGPNGQSITLPAAGYSDSDGFVVGVGSIGFYCSSTPGDSGGAWNLYFNSSEHDVGDGNRCCGKSVRLVQDQVETPEETPAE